jgi:hypothetical protein
MWLELFYNMYIYPEGRLNAEIQELVQYSAERISTCIHDKSSAALAYFKLA